MAEIKIISWNYAPKGWAFCNGQMLPINQNQALFSILGTTYGGNGQTTFALPNLQGRIPIHMGAGYILGQQGGETAHTLKISELPAHTHPPQANTGAANQGAATNNFWAALGASYAGSINQTMSPAATLPTGGSQAHDNMSPYLVLNFIIALQGIFPSRN
jgi:microcystin-dependent protein